MTRVIHPLVKNPHYEGTAILLQNEKQHMPTNMV